MQYIKCDWIHDNDQDPVLLFSELDDDRLEIRKVEVFRDGRMESADKEHLTGSTQLGIVPVPSIEEIASDSQFIPSEIGQAEFESLWTKNLRGRGS